MSDPLDRADAYKPPPIEDGADLLRRIGWHPSDMKQISNPADWPKGIRTQDAINDVRRDL